MSLQGYIMLLHLAPKRAAVILKTWLFVRELKWFSASNSIFVISHGKIRLLPLFLSSNFKKYMCIYIVGLAQPSEKLFQNPMKSSFCKCEFPWFSLSFSRSATLSEKWFQNPMKSSFCKYEFPWFSLSLSRGAKINHKFEKILISREQSWSSICPQ